MLILDIDIGNSCLKWCLRSAEGVVDSGFVATKSRDWSVLSALSSREPDRIRVSNVAGADAAERIRLLGHNDLGLKVEFASAGESLGQVSSGYLQPELLGVDRWLAIVAGWNIFQQRCVVVDAGSALTLDFIDGDGRHEGGYILPGREMMLSALYGGTSGVRVAGEDQAELAYGRTTTQGVQNGCLAMALALLTNTASAELSLAGRGMVLTGGDAPVLLKYLPSTVCYRPDLVLEGLSLALP